MAANYDVIVVGGGPAGLRAAEVGRATGATVILSDAQPSVGRKFLIAGRGGLNLTHGEPVENFPARYATERGRWIELLRDFSPDDLRAWAAELEVDTYVGTSGRVFPRGQKAAVLLRAWVRRLQASGVQFQMNCRLSALMQEDDNWRVGFESGDGAASFKGKAVVLALGGASWPETGSDGTWPALLAGKGVSVTAWAPANCGWNVDWPPELLERAEGLPLKNLSVSAGGDQVSGELLITRYGIEGGAVYRLGRELRAMAAPQLQIDLKPQLSLDALRQRLAGMSPSGKWSQALKISPAATALLETLFPHDCLDHERLAARVKNFTLALRGPRPIAEAISSAGGVGWDELDRNLMLHKMPGVYLAGEMIDWEAPTGGYLLQGCFSTGTRAGRAAAKAASSI